MGPDYKLRISSERSGTGKKEEDGGKMIIF